MCGSCSAQFTRIYNQASLKELCASILKQHYISNVRNTLDKLFAKEFSASEMCYLTGPAKDKLIPVMLHILSMSSYSLLPISSDVMGKYYSRVFMRVEGEKGSMSFPPKFSNSLLLPSGVGTFPHKYT